ncbi:unnamed protein product [Prorocentrum cordatum]|uniref:MYND-type domain-containing protein n=1 Tax=Prorocentrum cordatum TaxID=2364126 RepID=A0ABN9SXP7_9DINO|nr:unnamed protein product [Polarella glacialis]
MGPEELTQRCLACGRERPPARCARCLRAWFCGPECQRAAWRAHKADCRLQSAGAPGPAGTPAPPSEAAWRPLLPRLPPVARAQRSAARALAWERGADAVRRLLQEGPARAPGGATPEARAMELCQAGRYLDALGEALLCQVGDDATDTPRVRQLAEMLWERQGFEPIPPERHKYSLLHAAPPRGSTEAQAPAPARMIPFSAEQDEAGSGGRSADTWAGGMWPRSQGGAAP